MGGGPAEDYTLVPESAMTGPTSPSSDGADALAAVVSRCVGVCTLRVVVADRVPSAGVLRARVLRPPQPA